MEKNCQEEICIFDDSHLHYINLQKLLFEGKAIHNIKQIKYALEYLNALRDVEMTKVESMTRYLMENFEYMKNLAIEDFLKKNKNSDDPDPSCEWSNKTNSHKLAIYINHPEKKNKDQQTRFKHFPLQITTLPKQFYHNPTIIRFYWNKCDIREFQRKEYSPYISISGVFFIDQLIYPDKPQISRSWEIREMIGSKYKMKDFDNRETNLQNLNFHFRIELHQNIFLKDNDNILVGRYEEGTGKWNLNGINNQDFNKEKKYISFYCNELDNFSIILERKNFFPYLNWYLRCTDDKKAILDIESKKKFNFI